MKQRPTFPDRFVFSWRWQNKTKYEKQELVPLYWLIHLAITAVQPGKKLVVVEIFWVEFKWSVLILTVRPT